MASPATSVTERKVRDIIGNIDDPPRSSLIDPKFSGCGS
jgi:hypothetical protein